MTQHGLSKSEDKEVKHRYWYRNLSGSNEFEFTSNEMARLADSGVFVYVETTEVFDGFNHYYTKKFDFWERDIVISEWKTAQIQENDKNV